MWDISWSKWEVDRLRHFYILPPPIRSIRQTTWHSSYGTCLKVSKRFRKTETWQVFVFLHSIQPHQKSSPIQKKRDLLPCDLVADSDALYIILPETNSSPLKNRPLEVWRFLLETHHFQGRAVSLREGNFVQTKLLGLHKFTSKPGQLSSDLREFLDLTPFPSAQVNLFFSERQLRPRVTGRVKNVKMCISRSGWSSKWWLNLGTSYQYLWNLWSWWRSSPSENPSDLPSWSNLPEEWTFLHNNCDWNKHLEKNKRSGKPHTHPSCSDIVVMKLMARNSVGSVLLDTGMSVECHREDLFTMTYSW